MKLPKIRTVKQKTYNKNKSTKSKHIDNISCACGYLTGECCLNGTCYNCKTKCTHRLQVKSKPSVTKINIHINHVFVATEEERKVLEHAFIILHREGYCVSKTMDIG